MTTGINTSDVNIYRCTPRQVRAFVLETIMAGLVPFVRSSPGMGKSSIMHSIADECNLHMIDHRLSTSQPEDMTGLPRFDENGHAHFVPFGNLFPLQTTPIPEGKDGWMLFLDEINSAPKQIQAAAYKLILDRMTGQHKLHDHLVITAAGNLDTDKAITNNIGTAMQSRLVHIEMEINFQEWLEDVAIKQNYDPRIIAFLSFSNSRLMTFRPDHSDVTFACPRTWEFMNRLVQGKKISIDKTPLYSGTIGSGVAVEFVQFVAVEDRLIKIPEILRDPHNCVIPNDNNIRWLIISNMAAAIDDANFDALATYANRFDLTFRVLFYRSAMIRAPQLRRHPAFTRAMVELDRYLNEPLSLVP